MNHVGNFLAISITMQMRRYDAGRIVQCSASSASLEANGCRYRVSACVALLRRPPWLMNVLKQHKTLTKYNF